MNWQRPILRLAATSLCAAVLAGSLLISVSVRADSAGAERLRQELWEFVKLQNALTFGEDIDLYQLDAIDVMPRVTPTGDAYSVVLRNFRMADSGPDGNALEIGDVTMTMTPLEEQRYRITDLALPSKMTLRDSDGSGAVLTPILSRFEGVWSARYLSFLTIDGEFSSAGMAMLNEPGALGTGRISMILDSVEGAPGVFDQKASFEVLNLILLVPDGQDFAIGRIAAASSAKQANLGVTADTLRRIAKDRKGAIKELTSQDIRAMLPWLGDMDMRIQKIKLSDGEETGILVEEMKVAGRYDAGEGALGSAGLDLALLGMQATSSSGNFEGLDLRLIPNRFTLSLGLEDVPNDALWAMLIDAAFQDLSGDDAGGEAFDQFDSEAAAALMEANGTRLRLNEFSFANQIAALAGTGELRLSEAAVYFVEGGVIFELVGVEALRALAQEMMTSNDPEKKENGQALLGTLGMMMIYSQGPETPAPTVPDAQAFAIRLTPEGTVTVNGLPVFGAQ